MKRLSLEQKLRQLRIAKQRFHTRQKRRGKTRISQARKFVRPEEEITAPKIFNLTPDAGIEVGKFLKAVAVRVLKDKQPVRLNFKDTVQFHVPATILLFAEIDRIVALSDLPKPMSIIDPISRKPREVLKQIGLHIITSDRCDIIPRHEDVVHWKTAKGINQSGDAFGDLVKAIAEDMNKADAKRIETSDLWRSCSEAISNTVDHAYIKPRRDKFAGLPGTKWWMFSQIKDEVLTVAVCDLGCGYRETINETIPEGFISHFKATFKGGNKDALAIATAMAHGRSGTGDEHRGKGSKDVLSLLEKHGSGKLTVLSNTGWLSCEMIRNKMLPKKYGDVGIDVGGTIVWWNLPLKELKNAGN